MRWLLLEEVTSIEKGSTARSESRVPDSPYSPELLMIEMMAQTGALLIGAESNFKEDLIFAKIDSADFPAEYQVGERIQIEASSENLRPEGAWLDAQVRRGEEIIGRARILLMNVGRLVAEREDPITFHEAFMNFFQIRDKVR